MWSLLDLQMIRSTETDPKYANRHDDCVNWMPILYIPIKRQDHKIQLMLCETTNEEKILEFSTLSHGGYAHIMFREILNWKDD